ncbi:hypothetical protein F1737_10455 [Methanoplanus sp. FWC-SCC4]|uniref:Uncharacterized protein n=1 Tax=Methanochimaera problematica TaxID=2609417 RepID=A0AA97I4L6_9EURY|nr:hypothetical protein F1737_10455 [Methanoplanus sp. FWC-SCC4]
MTYKCGEKPGIGTYKCTKCGATKRLDDKTDTLPPCSVCNHCEFKK